MAAATIMIRRGDHVTDPHGETAPAIRLTGLRKEMAMRRLRKLPYVKDPA